MSVTANFVLLNRTRLESEVAPMVADVLHGGIDEALRVLRSQFLAVSSFDQTPDVFFQCHMRLAIEILEGRVTEAFVNEMTPVITEPVIAWHHNVETHVRGALALSLCAERPAPGLSPALGFWRPFSWIIRNSSSTADEVAGYDDPALVEPIRTGIFQEPEVFLRRTCLERIADETQYLIAGLLTLSESEETIQSLQHFHALMAAPLRNPNMVVLRGYI